ncbi:MAG: hypothetical protein NCW75_01850 [Phycisphaera sp.]|nr:MAG: hypothetical protein NCW75_01850 [Phycisphaera sp.]
MTKHPNQRKPSHWRWPRRITLVLLAGVLLTVASSWILQWRAFRASASMAAWSIDPSTNITPLDYHYQGNGIFESTVFYLSNDTPPSVPIDVHHVPEVPWFIIQRDGRSWIHRNEWDYSQTVHRDAIPKNPPLIPSAHYRLHPNEFTWINPNEPLYELSQTIVPDCTIDIDPLKSHWFDPARYFAHAPGWFAASSFRRSRDQSLHALHRPVERWSAQRCGWPMDAMMTEQYAIGPRPPIERVEDMPLVSLRHGLKGGLILHHQPQHPMLHPLGHHSLPLMPLWPGFAANTAAYAGTIALLWLTIAGGTHLLGTKKRRRKRGLCEACGYDIQGLTTCPECGNARAPA